MHIYSLDINDFSIDTFALIGIHTTLEDYKLAYLLNKHLCMHFYRERDDIDFKNKQIRSFFSLYTYQNKKLDCNFFLVSNVCKQLSESSEIELFSENEIITYLLSNQKKVDYFIKIEGEIANNYITSVVNKIQKIPEIVTAYTIDTETLKSKEALIF